MKLRAKTLIAQEELDWYFNQSESAIGIRSSWNALVNASCFAASPTLVADHYTDGILRAVDRRRKIEAKLSILATSDQRALRAAHDAAIVPPAILVRAFGFPLAGVVALLDQGSIKRLLDALIAKSLNSASTAQTLYIATTRTMIQQRYTEALTQYTKDKS